MPRNNVMAFDTGTNPRPVLPSELNFQHELLEPFTHPSFHFSLLNPSATFLVHWNARILFLRRGYQSPLVDGRKCIYFGLITPLSRKWHTSRNHIHLKRRSILLHILAGTEFCQPAYLILVHGGINHQSTMWIWKKTKAISHWNRSGRWIW